MKENTKMAGGLLKYPRKMAAAKCIMGCLLVASISNRLSVSVRTELLLVHCANCTCASSNGAKLQLSTFRSPIQLSACVCVGVRPNL